MTEEHEREFREYAEEIEARIKKSIPQRRLFDWTVTFGNILTIGVFIIGGVLGYARLEEQVTAMRLELTEHKTLQTEQLKEFQRRDVQDTRNRFIDESLVQIKEQLAAVLKEIKRIY